MCQAETVSACIKNNEQTALKGVQFCFFPLSGVSEKGEVSGEVSLVSWGIFIPSTTKRLKTLTPQGPLGQGLDQWVSSTLDLFELVL